MSLLKAHPRVLAVQVGRDLDTACRDVNENRRVGDSHIWNNGHCVIIARHDGSSATAAIGDWIIVRLFDGAVFALSDEAFRDDYRLEKARPELSPS